MNKNFILKKWDSNFFNQNIFEFCLIEGNSIIDIWPKNSLIMKKVDSIDYSSLNHINNLNFDFIEGELLFQKKISPESASKQDIPLSNYLASINELSELKSIVDNLYSSSRFREPWFSADNRNAFYKIWVENAVLGLFDDCCLILKASNRISGFVTIRVRNNKAVIGLIGVSKGFQNQGVGKKLLVLAEQYSIAQGAKNIVVSTQTSNIFAANLYSKNCYRLFETSYWFYKKV